MAEGRASDGSLSARFGGSLGVLSNNLSGLLDGSGCACRRHAARLYALSKSPNNNLCAVSSECPTAFQPQAASVPQTDQVRSPKSSKKRRSKGEKEKDKRSTWRWSILDQQVSPEKQPAGQASFSGLPYAKQWMARQSIDRFISTVNDEVDSAASPETSTGVYAARAKSKTFRMPHAARAEKSASVPSAAALRESESQESKASDAEERLLEARAVLNRANKIRTLLFKNEELEQSLKAQKDTVQRLVRTNDALEKQLLQLNARASQVLPRQKF